VSEAGAFLSAFTDPALLALVAAGTAAGIYIAALDPSVTALLVTGEGLGHRVVHFLRKLRLEPGRDVSIFAHEMPGISEFCDPPLTTIEQDFDRLTAVALELLESTKARRRLVDYRFHERESIVEPQLTAAPPARRV
jgi:DNA-binding LacI/PurR family transcriptional regulator